MSDETYYTVLNVKETASASEIKTAYRDLIKQVHPDTIANLAPYLRKMAEDKSKEINEAYTVLSNSSKRRDYDKQLAAYRHQNAPPAPPTSQAPPTPPPQQPSQCPICGRSDGGHSAACVNYRTSQATSTSSGPYCNTCGTSLYASGYCPRCSKFATPAATTPKPASTPKVIRRFGYNWAPLMRWSREHPIVALAIPVVLVLVIAAALSSNDTSSQGDLNCLPSQRVEVNGRFVCQQVSVQPSQTAATSNAASPATAVVSEESAPSKPTVSVSGTYLGTVHNKTVNLSSTVAVVLRQNKAGVLEGCMQVKPPLYCSGAVQGSVRGAFVNFVAADITFHGDALRNAITGSYVVSRQDGQQLGDFRLTKQTGTKASYGCADGAVVEFEVVDEAPPKTKPAPKVLVGSVRKDYAPLNKRCAFRPPFNGYCALDNTVAYLRAGDPITILSPSTRAEDGSDIYRVRTRQGWVGWINSNFITIDEP